MSTWELKEQEWEALDRLRFATTEAAVFRNATIILMTAVGRGKASIAQDLGCSPTTVRQHPPAVSAAGVGRITARHTAGTAVTSHSGISDRVTSGAANAAWAVGLWL